MENIRTNFKMDGSIDGNTLVGHASVLGNLDRGADVLFPGIWSKDVLKRFLERGFVPLSHQWSELPIAMPTKAAERGNVLEVEAVFHSTQKAQDAKTVIRERLENNLSFGLSVGFTADRDGMAYFETGEALLEFAEKGGYDLALFDKKAIKAYKGWGLRGIWKAKELFEFSPCSVPMNQDALATGLKSLADPESLGGIGFSDHLDAVLGAVRGIVIRARSIQEKRSEKGGLIGANSIELLRSIDGELGHLLAEVDAATAARGSTKDAELNALRAQVEALRLAV